MKHFLIVYDRSRNKLLTLQEFSSSERRVAMDRRFELEMREREHPQVEVVVLNADSLDAIKRTHGRYFSSPAQLLARAKI